MHSFLLACSFAFLACSNNIKEKPRNIIFILADDLGHSDVGYMNQKNELITPNIDRLAKKGMTFTNAYAASPVCFPTRASILTGKYPATLQLTCHIPGVGMEEYITRQSEGKKLMEAEFIDHLPLNEVTFAEVLKEQGYKTAFMGKWHLAGSGSQKTTDGVVNALWHPDQQGFGINIGGCAYGQPADYFSPYQNAAISNGTDGEYLTDRLGKEACQFFEANKEENFLLYLSFYTVHTPHQAPKEAITNNKGNSYYAMIEKLDENVGKVLEKIEKLKLTKSTLVIFYSDNGGIQSNSPLRSAKGSLYEGGIRVPLIFSLPGIVPEGTICTMPVTSTDLFPTLMDATGTALEKYDKGQLEGVNLWPLITRKKEYKERTIYWHFPHHRNDVEKSMASAVREGDWKLIWEFESKEKSLLNLKDDVGENMNLVNNHPEKADYLYSKLINWLSRKNASLPQANPKNKK